MFVLDPAGIALVAVLLALYGRAVAVLGWRGYRVPRAQQALWYSGVALMAIALLGPPDALADDLLSAHMGQHLLIADLAAPLLLAGARTPVLQFLLPRAVLVPLARTRWLRALFRTLRRPRARPRPVGAHRPAGGRRADVRHRPDRDVLRSRGVLLDGSSGQRPQGA